MRLGVDPSPPKIPDMRNCSIKIRHISLILVDIISPAISHR